MRSQTYGDKQRDAQQRKKQEELWKKSHPEGEAASESSANPDKPNEERKKSTKKETPGRRSA
jgi:hypothetical protein